MNEPSSPQEDDTPPGCQAEVALLTEAGAARRRVGRYVMAEAKLRGLEDEARRVGAQTLSLADGRHITVLVAESDLRGNWSTAACAYRYEDESAAPPWEGTRPWLERDEVLAILAEREASDG